MHEPASQPQTYPVILGTAGHIDHGKTTLVRALTGIDTDRLKEEKERGITIELGFAHLDVGGRRFGLIDVPGHERFIKAMVAGAVGVDVVVLVVAADEGVMPQTREHLDICGLLGITRGVVAVTKRDLVDDEWLELVHSELARSLEGTFLESARVIPVSATTGQGMDTLREELVRLASAVPPRPADGLFRLPLDRIFTMKGFGTVVTGTVLGGRLRVGDEVVVHPGGPTNKVRGLEVHGAPANEARAGMRTAVNLASVERADLARGDLLAHPGTVEPTHLLDARLRLLRACRAPLGGRTRVLLHHGTAQVLATVIVVDRDELRPGDEGLVQLHTDVPVAALPGDRFILRGFTPQEHYGTTIGGGELLRVHAPKVRRASGEAAETLRRLADAAPAARIAVQLKSAGPAGASRGLLVARLGLAPAALEAALNRLVQTGEAWKEGELHLHTEVLARLEAATQSAVDAYHAERPERPGMPREELRSKLPRGLAPRVFDALVAGLVRRAALVAEKDFVRRPRHAPDARAGGDGLAESLHARFVEWALEPPRPEDLPATLGRELAEVRAALDRLQREGRLVRIRPDFLVARSVLDDLRTRLERHLVQAGQITPQEFKAMVGASRKYAIPLAEHFDAEKLTLRVGDLRRLRGR